MKATEIQTLNRNFISVEFGVCLFVSFVLTSRSYSDVAVSLFKRTFEAEGAEF